MAKYRKVDPYIWNDIKFNSLSAHGKLAFLFLLTHPHMSSIGAMRATIGGLVSELSGISEKGFREPFDKGMAKADDKACFIWLPNFTKYNPPENQNVVMAWGKSMQDLPECEHKYLLLQHIEKLLEGYPKGYMESFRKGLPNGMLNGMAIQEQEQEQEQDKDIYVDKISDVVKSYHENCPSLPKVRVMSETRKRYALARMREKHKNHNGSDSSMTEYWDGFFQYVETSNFLTGKTKPTGGRESPFVADFEWLLKKENFIKIIEGKYH